jgi:hypothetical protein
MKELNAPGIFQINQPKTLKFFPIIRNFTSKF